MAAAPWSPGDEVDVLVGQADTGQWWPATVLEIHRSGEVGRVRLQRAVGALRPPRNSPAPSEESRVPLAWIAPAGTHVPRWRLCGGGELVEVKVGNRWRRGVVFARYERRWFDAIVYIVDTLARRVLISYLGWPKSTPNPRNGPLAEEWISFESPRLRRLSLPPAAAAGATAARSAQRASDEGEGDGGEWSVGDRVEVLIDQKDDDSRYVYWRYQGAYARGVMGREDGPLECKLGVNVLSPDAGAEEDGEGEGEQQPAAAAAASPCTVGVAGQSSEGEAGNPPEPQALVAMQGPAGLWSSWGNASAFSSTSSAASSDGSSSTSGLGSGSEGWSPPGTGQRVGVEGEGNNEAPLFVFVKASSPNLAPQGTHLKACSAKCLGLVTKPPATPAALPVGESAALAQPLLFPPVTV